MNFLNRPRLLVIDTETGGYDPANRSLLVLGCVVWTGGGLGATLELQVRESKIRADPDALAKNRIDLGRLRRLGLSPRDAVVRFEAFIDEHYLPGETVVLAGHNVAFDVGFLKRLYRLAKKPYPDRLSHRVLDTASVLRLLALAEVVPTSTTSSDGAFAYFGIEPNQSDRHTALGDAHATALLISSLVELLRRSHRPIA